MDNTSDHSYLSTEEELMTHTETKRQERGKKRIAEILDAASDVFAEVGYEGATTNAIAAHAGMSPGSLYQFFPNKEAIAEALAARYAEEMQAAHSVVLDPSVARLPLDEMVDRIVDPLIGLSLANPGAKALLAGSDISPQLASSTQRLHEAVLDRVDALIAVRVPGMKAKERARAAQVSVQIFKAILPMVMSAGRNERASVVRELKSALRGYLESIES
jgi:AcrR family transcriptional regulator